MSWIHLYYLVSLFLGYANGFLVPNGKTTVQSPIGEIVGFTSTITIGGTQRTVRNFLGIPFAEPPVISARFRKPIPKSRFLVPFDASNYGHSCFQFEGRFKAPDNVSYSEDCLTLNIFAPEELPRSVRPYPVMIYIYGGGFSYGMSSQYDSGYISIAGDVIVVTINYRLNVFGFLSSSNNESAGNYGLMDQQLAIKWVHDNIHSFRGDVNRVTIFGESAGAASVIFQSLYQGNRGLFQRAIAQSGSALSPWALRRKTVAVNYSTKFARAAGCSQNETESMIKCLQTKSSQELRDVMNTDAKAFAVWKPVIDGTFIKDDPVAFLTGQDTSHDINHVFLDIDLIIGVNSKEGLNTFFYEFGNKNFSKSDYHDTLIPRILYENYKGKITKVVKDAAVFEYTDWDHMEDKYKQFDRFIDLISDLKFFVPTAKTALKHCVDTNKTTYVYKLSTAPPYRYTPLDTHVDGPTVANHADDLMFLFDPWVAESGYTLPRGLYANVTDEQRNVAKAMITMWTNFAHSGNPNRPVDVQRYINTTWAEYEPMSQRYLDITPGMSLKSLKRGFSADAVQFWTKLIPVLTRSS